MSIYLETIFTNLPVHSGTDGVQYPVESHVVSMETFFVESVLPVEQDTLTPVPTLTVDVFTT